MYSPMLMTFNLFFQLQDDNDSGYQSGSNTLVASVSKGSNSLMQHSADVEKSTSSELGSMVRNFI